MDQCAFTEDAGHTVDGVGQFDFEALDSFEAKIKEALAKGESVALVRQLVEVESNERVNEAIAAVICYIADHQKPRLAADHVAWLFGMRMRQGVSSTQLANKNRVSKEAFSQGVLRLQRILGVKPSRSMRSVKAREAMAAAYRKRHGQTKATQSFNPLRAALDLVRWARAQSVQSWHQQRKDALRRDLEPVVELWRKLA